MKTSSIKFTKIFSLLGVSLLLSVASFSQTKFHAQTVDLTVKGTSNVHDWHINSKQGQSEAVVVLAGDKVSAIQKLSFSTPAKSLKSESNAMDKNTYKALKAEANPNINFELVSANLTPVDGTTYKVNGVGKLTIAGVTKQTDVNGTCKVNPDKSLTITGTKKFKMTEYKVEPPTALFGTIKTGDEVTINYNVKIKS
jgi:polyisoprenoid-binding protein YceI